MSESTHDCGLHKLRSPHCLFLVSSFLLYDTLPRRVRVLNSVENEMNFTKQQRTNQPVIQGSTLRCVCQVFISRSRDPGPQRTVARPTEHIRQKVQCLARVVVVAGANEASQG